MLTRGFLPNDNPFVTLAVVKEGYRPLVDKVEGLFSNLTTFLNDDTAREEIVCQLRDVVPLVDHEFTETFGNSLMEERGFLIYSCFAAAFINGGTPLPRLAKEITIPVVRFGARIRRSPVLDYQSYILHNWQLTGSTVRKENVEPLFTFTGTSEEKNYVTSRVIVEYMTRGITSLDTLKDRLERMLQATKNMQLPAKAARYLKPFVGVKYEGWGWVEPQSFPIPLTVQSPAISYIAKLLGIPYDDADYQNHRLLNNCDVIRSTNPLDATSSIVYNDCLELFAELADIISSPDSDFMWNRFGTTKLELVKKYRR